MKAIDNIFQKELKRFKNSHHESPSYVLLSLGRLLCQFSANEKEKSVPIMVKYTNVYRQIVECLEHPFQGNVEYVTPLVKTIRNSTEDDIYMQ